jgi:hypothetical protein
MYLSTPGHHQTSISNLEKDIERSIRLDCALLLKDDDFPSVHGNLHYHADIYGTWKCAQR